MPKCYPVDLKIIKFRSESAAREFFAAMLSRYSPGDRVNDADAAVLAELLKRHPEAGAKLGEGIDHFEVMGALYRSKCFSVHRTDGSHEDFSYRRCVSED